MVFYLLFCHVDDNRGFLCGICKDPKKVSSIKRDFLLIYLRDLLSDESDSKKQKIYHNLDRKRKGAVVEAEKMLDNMMFNLRTNSELSRNDLEYFPYYDPLDKYRVIAGY